MKSLSFFSLSAQRKETKEMPPKTPNPSLVLPHMASAYQIQPDLYFAQFSDYPPSFMTKGWKFLTKSGYWEIVPLISSGNSFLPALFISLIRGLLKP